MAASILGHPKAAARSTPALDSSCPRCREISCESAEVCITKSDSKSVAYEFRTKSAQSGGLETNGRRERISGLGRCVAVRRFVREARGYWASMRAQQSAEHVGLGRTGGEGGIRTPDTVARMPHFECGAFNHSATSPDQGVQRKWRGLSIESSRCKQGRGCKPRMLNKAQTRSQWGRVAGRIVTATAHHSERDRARRQDRAPSQDSRSQDSRSQVYCEPASPAFFTISPTRTISACMKRLSSSGGGD